MLKNSYEAEMTPFDLQVFETFVPKEHYLRRLKETIDFKAMREIVAECYSPDQGRGAIDPVQLFKLSVLQFHYDLSDERVMREAEVNIAFRYFLDLGAGVRVPEASLLSQFRTRVGAERFAQAFQEILRQARAAGLVRDRLRLKDATHLIANIAVPTTLRLMGQTREQLLSAAEGFAAAEVGVHRQTALEIREATADLKAEARLLARVKHLQELVAWGEGWLERLEIGAPPVGVEVYETFVSALAIARKVLGDRQPRAKDKLVSLTDIDARRSRHGDYYDGYLLDLSIDADSGLICALDVLAANADEAANALPLIESEEAAHGNDIESLSIDGIGFNGPVLKALGDDPNGPQLTVYVPPKPDWSPTPHLFQPEDFNLNQSGDELTCPNGETTRIRFRDVKGHSWIFHFKASQCRTCPLRDQCLRSNKKSARQVAKNDFNLQYKAAKQRATTEEYKQICKLHPAVERKLNELVRWHDGRRVRYRGRRRAKVQYFLLGIVVNCKRIVNLLSPAPALQLA